MFTHIMVGTNDMDTATKFYDATVGALGGGGQAYGERRAYATGEGPVFIIGTPVDGAPANHNNGGTIGFAAPDKDAVDAWYDAGMANGGKDEGAPGPRPNAPGNAYGAYLRDPDGHKICAYCQLPEGE